ncbi:MAG TPA: hypothetical protein VHG91_02340 [Longimicrobium sp.]|nr:hypothetical protein [Longimicrobium sp.]
MSGRSLDGVEIPDVFFAHAPHLRELWVHISPVEISFFSGASPAETLAVCAAVANEALPGVRPGFRMVRDHYYDTPGLSLFRQGVSVRAREYQVNPRPAYFEVIAVSWREEVVGAPAEARGNHVLVQSFERSERADFEATMERYAAAGLRKTASIAKSRTVFILHPGLSSTETGEPVTASDTRLLVGVQELVTSDAGLRLIVDELHDSPFPERALVEVEFGLAHAAEGVALAARVRALLGERLREKALNKIAYLMEAA